MSEYKEGTESHYRDAPYYDHAYKRRREDVYFYGKLARELGGPILELGVGTGRVAAAVARVGVPIVGVDLMESMLETARNRVSKLPKAARPLVDLHQGDIRTVRLGERFPVIISPFNVWMHLYSRQDFEQACDTVKAHLEPGGAFVFDVLNPYPKALSRDPQKTYWGRKFKHPTSKKMHNYAEVFDYRAASQVQHIHMFAETVDESEPAWTMQVAHRQYYPQELDTLLHYNGFEIEEKWGDFEGGAFHDNSDSQVFIVRVR